VVECLLAKEDVASSSLVSRSIFVKSNNDPARIRRVSFNGHHQIVADTTGCGRYKEPLDCCAPANGRGYATESASLLYLGKGFRQDLFREHMDE
jgi:hypothetical protein